MSCRAKTAHLVQIVDAWPDAGRVAQLLKFVGDGGTLVWFLRPGLEATWPALPQDLRTQLLELLPSAPLADGPARDLAGTLAIASPGDPLLHGLSDERFGIASISVLRVAPFATGAGSAAPLLDVVPSDPREGGRRAGLLYRRQKGSGLIYTFATIPDQQFTTLPIHPLFLPLMVRMCLPTTAPIDAQNVEIGEPTRFARRGDARPDATGDSGTAGGG